MLVPQLLLRRPRGLGILEVCRAYRSSSVSTSTCTSPITDRLHAIYGHYEAAIQIETGTILARSLPPRVSALVREWRESYRAELAANWERARRHERLQWIPGLE